MRTLRSFLIAASVTTALTSGVSAAEPSTCKPVRFSDVGWTDVTAVTEMASLILDALGYQPSAELLSMPVTFSSLKSKNVDVFLGNWMPHQIEVVAPYLEEGSLEQLSPNLEGAKYTLAVPTYTYNAGLKNFADIEKFRDGLGGRIFGIESGNDGNRKIQEMIDNNKFGLTGFTLVESSEAGMLSAVERELRSNKDVVFLGWEPHPMNVRFDMAYLDGGDEVFGENYGAATVHTVVRGGYSTECPNAVRFFKSLVFSLEMENELMAAILNDGKETSAAVMEWLKANPAAIEPWLDGVSTFDGGDGLAAVKAKLGL